MDREVLQGLCHAFGSAATFDELATSTARWARSATRCDRTYVSFTLPDATGRLRVAWRGGPGIDGGRKRSARRRTAFRTMIPLRMEAGQDRALALFPLVSRGTSFGVLEITAPPEAVDEGWEILEVLASQVAIALRNVSERRYLKWQVETLEGAATLGRDLARARDPGTAVRLATRFMAERFELPVAAWVATVNSGGMVLTSMRGLGSRKREELHGLMGIVPAWNTSSSSERDVLLRRFADVLGARNIAVVEARDVLVLVANAPDSLQPTLDAMRSLLGGILPLLALTARAEQRDQQLDMGIAWTAHELRAPLIDVKAVLELVLRADAGTPISLAMLRRSLVGLEELVEMTESLLGWAVGARPLQRRVADVVKVVADVVHACELGWGRGRVTVSSPPRVMARIDPFQLRRAIENVLRNALTCSAPDSKVTVTVNVNEKDDFVAVSVRDRGPGIPQAEREAIFDPLTKGTAHASQPGRAGLGLFITRRVIEAHGGKILLDSDRTGSTFHLQVPIDLARSRRSAS